MVARSFGRHCHVMSVRECLLSVCSWNDICGLVRCGLLLLLPSSAGWVATVVGDVLSISSSTA